MATDRSLTQDQIYEEFRRLRLLARALEDGTKMSGGHIFALDDYVLVRYVGPETSDRFWPGDLVLAYRDTRQFVGPDEQKVPLRMVYSWRVLNYFWIDADTLLTMEALDRDAPI